jgi:ribosome-binding factor A
MSIRTEKVAGEVQQSLARLLQTEFSDLTNGLLTITKVRMAPDLKSGRVYVSVLGGTSPSKEVLAALKQSAPQLRYALGRTLNLKFTPELFYYLDDTQEEVARVEEIFRKIREESGRNKRPDDSEAAGEEKEA